MTDRWWNVRAVEYNGESTGAQWVPVQAHNPQRAAVAYCHRRETWEDMCWQNGDDAVVEVEGFHGEGGLHRLVICAYDVLDFSATPWAEARGDEPKLEGDTP